MRAHERRLGERVGEAMGARGIFEQRPVEHGALVVVARPFDIGERDAPEHAALDRLDHVRMPQRRDVALALQLRLDGVDAARDVDREHQLQIDGEVLGSGGQAMSAAIRAASSAVRGSEIGKAHGDIRDEAAWDIASPRWARMRSLLH